MRLFLQINCNFYVALRNDKMQSVEVSFTQDGDVFPDLPASF
jgi:hypothetical protein